jgi:RNA-directed DNA polymerase
MFLNHILLISDNLYFLRLVSYFFKEFLFLRGFDNLDIITSSINSLYSVSFSGLIFDFIQFEDTSVYIRPSTDLVRRHKIKLKILIKNNQNAEVFNFLTLLNKVIFFWSIYYSGFDCFWDIWGELDVYLYKILWKWARRRHPRRPNTWIFYKYWRYFSGSWRFFSLNTIKGNIRILRSHSVNLFIVYRLPFSINSFDCVNTRKINFFCFNKYKFFFVGILKLLWYKQNGICFFCKKNFSLIDFNSVKLYRFSVNKNYISNFVLVHSYCCL